MGKKLAKMPEIYEITRDLNAIPKGFYRLHHRESAGGLTFYLGTDNTIFFTVWNFNEHDIRKVSFQENEHKLTAVAQFVRRYWELLDGLRSENLSFDPQRPITACALASCHDPSGQFEARH